jgi:hypothetical protein
LSSSTRRATAAAVKVLEVLAQSKIVFVVHSLFGTAAKPYALNAGQQIRQQSEA